METGMIGKLRHQSREEKKELILDDGTIKHAEW